MQALSWGPVLKQIRDDFQDFVEDGGWKFLMDDDEQQGSGDEEGEDSQEDDDPQFDEASGSEDFSEEDESDFSDEDSDDQDSGSGSDDDQSEGLSWDELEKKAFNEDRDAAQKRQMGNDSKQGGQRRKATGRR